MVDGNPEKVTDLRFLIKFTDGDRDKMETYISMFLHFVPAYILKIEKCTEDKNWAMVAMYAGLIKGQMVYVGIKKQDQLLKVIDISNSKKPSQKEIREELGRVKNYFEPAFQELLVELEPVPDE